MEKPLTATTEALSDDAGKVTVVKIRRVFSRLGGGLPLSQVGVYKIWHLDLHHQSIVSTYEYTDTLLGVTAGDQTCFRKFLVIACYNVHGDSICVLVW